MARAAAALASLASGCAALAACDEERATRRYFGAEAAPQAVPRYSRLSAEDFERLALSGRPFVLEDGGAEQPFVGWTCERFRREYPQALVQLQYAGDDSVRPITESWEEHLHRLPNADPGGPQYAPWYWGVKAADDAEEAPSIFAAGSENPLPRVQAAMRLPPVLRGGNKAEVLGSPEFWFSAPGAGATMHMDSHCESTLATQLSGTRRWRLGWAPRVPNGTLFAEGTYADGAVHGKGYAPPLEATVSEGESLFVPAGFLHETTNIGDSCAVSLTFQITDPIPAGYFRQSLRHLRRSADFRECWGLLGAVAALGGRAKPSLEAVRGRGGRIARAARAFYDVDGDGVSESELAEGWEAWREAEREAAAKGVKWSRPRIFECEAGRTEL